MRSWLLLLGIWVVAVAVTGEQISLFGIFVGSVLIGAFDARVPPKE